MEGKSLIQHGRLLFFFLTGALTFGTLGCAHAPNRAPASASHYVGDCMIMNETGRVLVMFGQGTHCLFFPDGSVAASADNQLMFFGPTGNVIWKRDFDVHHQINFDLEQKNILVLGSTYHRYRGQLMRFDRVAVFNREGRELKSFDFFDHIKELEIAVPESHRYYFRDMEKQRAGVPKSAKLEFSHANSFYEIPDNAAAKLNPAFAKGNYIVNDLDRFVFVLNAEMNKVLWIKHYSSILHDVQMQESGWLLIYRNLQPDLEYEDPNQFSSIDEVNPINGEKRILYRANPPRDFFGHHSGGVQRLPNGNILFSKIKNGGSVLEVDQDGKVVMQFGHPIVDSVTGKPGEFQQVKKVDLTEYFKNHRGL